MTHSFLDALDYALRAEHLEAALQELLPVVARPDLHQVAQLQVWFAAQARLAQLEDLADRSWTRFRVESPSYLQEYAAWVP